MRIGVCLKQVPDTSVRLQVGPNGLEPLGSGYLPVPNPYDEFALEAALRLREGAGAGEVILVTLAGVSVEETIFHGLAMGADRAIVLEHPSQEHPTPRVAGRLLARALEELRPDLVCCGERAVDDDAAQIGPILAESLGMPQVCGVETAALARGGQELRLRCRKGNSIVVLSCPLPCVATFLRGPELPRYPSMTNIFEAKGKRVELRWTALEADERSSRRVSLSSPAEDRAQNVIGGTPCEAVEALLRQIERSIDLA